MTDLGITYSPDSIDPEYNIGFGVQLGGGNAPSATVNGQVTNNPAAAGGGCLTCGKGVMGISWPIVILAIAALVLFMRK